MKIIRQYADMTIEFEGRDVKDLWREVAKCDELFGNAECVATVNGKSLRSKAIQLRVRDAKTKDGKDVEYFEMICVDNTDQGRSLKGFKKSFGEKQDKEKNLFPKNYVKAEDLPKGSLIGFNGWYKYVNEEEEK